VIQPGAQAASQAGSQTGANPPAQLPNTGGAESSWLTLALAGLLLLGAGSLALRRTRG
jgi:LPXTG-motif cell wall-anchored protein